MIRYKDAVDMLSQGDTIDFVIGKQAHYRFHKAGRSVHHTHIPRLLKNKMMKKIIIIEQPETGFFVYDD